ncbi:hypothetical protein E4U13_000817 [Claviceps humidiphila]|uniref:Mitochondrial distribution and morphology protein 10 n=1 Tax=Claviceps humidiphila TaxID=1294629 RepID=A0A9P7Q3K4_9HYPO|nr:hypothetical protein E4U13_000817 [Claviceps humidiphila]
MREFMDYVHSAFYEATGWSRDNSYAALDGTSAGTVNDLLSVLASFANSYLISRFSIHPHCTLERILTPTSLLSVTALLNFQTPRGLRLTLSSLASANFATSYQLGSVGVVDGSISYLFSSVPLRIHITPQSETVPLPELLRSYRPLTPLSPLSLGDGNPSQTTPPEGHTPSPSLPSLFYGRLYLPQSQLEALVVKRITPALQVQLSAVSAEYLRDGGTILGLAQYDVGNYAFEGLVSSDGGLLGLRGIYNFGGDAHWAAKRKADGAATTSTTTTTNGGPAERERIYGRFSTGGEIYYGTLNKSGGMSLGGRFATLPAHKGTPLCATLTMNPLMGNIAASYAVKAGRHSSLASRLEFNVFSYESAWAVGMELWRKPLRRLDVKEPTTAPWRPARERSFEAKLGWRLDAPGEEPEPRQQPELLAVSSPVPSPVPPVASSQPEPESILSLSKLAKPDAEEYAGVLKARLDQNLRIGILWEGRVKSLLFSLGSGIDLKKLDKPFRTLGLEIQFSS